MWLLEYRINRGMSAQGVVQEQKRKCFQCIEDMMAFVKREGIEGFGAQWIEEGMTKGRVIQQ